MARRKIGSLQSGGLNCSALSISHLEEMGYVVENVERWVRKTSRLRDYLGCIDLLAFKPGEPGMVGVQSTDLSNFSKRVRKILAEPRAELFLSVPHNRIVVHGWGDRGRGEDRALGLREVEINPEDFHAIAKQDPGNVGCRRRSED